jgi:hypothetical protein
MIKKRQANDNETIRKKDEQVLLFPKNYATGLLCCLGQIGNGRKTCEERRTGPFQLFMRLQGIKRKKEGG